MDIMEVKDNEMQRGLNQALYKYLPDSWIDFYIKKTRTAYPARVKNWNSGELQDINKKRLIEQVRLLTESFVSNGGNVSNFGSEISDKTYDVLTPRGGINPDIIAEVNPLTFFCSGCRKVYGFKSSETFLKFDNGLSQCCQKSLKQISLVYACECGWAGPVTPRPCPNQGHDFEFLKYTGRYAFICSKDGRILEMRKKCPNCGKLLFPQNALDQSNYIPFSFSLIDLLDMDEEEFLSNEELGAKVILAYWLGQIDELNYKNLIKNGIPKESDETKNVQYQLMVKQFMNNGLSKEQAENFAKMAVSGLSSTSEVDKIKDYIDINIVIQDANKLNKQAIEILEFKRILNTGSVSTLEDAKRISKILNTHSRPENYDKTAEKFGIKTVQASGNVPFVFCSYGYTRKNSDPVEAAKSKKPITLTAFPQERSEKKNVYATKLNTEGILFEIDRKRIVEWLILNKFLSQNAAPDMSNDIELKKWFINYVNTDKISTFSNINRMEDSITYYVYNLLHSMSHAFLKQAAYLCGLDKNSLSEYILPNIPAIFIYCQNSQGFSLGALFNLFEAYFDKWLTSMRSELEKCIFDPICIERDRACAGCLYLNEVSCIHFNKDLDRRFLIGWYDKDSGEKIHGFWEDALNG